MVEGHGVHRVANRHKQLLLHRKFKATSPNGRFTEGAKAINNKALSRIEAIGKNLFYFFGTGPATVVVHIHFGMSGRFATFSPGNAPPLKPTTRLHLQDEDNTIGAHLSAMTCEAGDLEQYNVWAAKLGPDPLRDTADFERLWQACGVPNCRGGKASIGAVLMDQKRIAGVGNIYRAEICFKARVHPNQPANTLGRATFELVWAVTVDLMRRGVLEGSILTLDPDDQAKDLSRRRYVYNQQKCFLCQSTVQSWKMKNRTCYACLTCQPMVSDGAPETRDVQVFKSRCAPEASDVKNKPGKRKRTTKASVSTVKRSVKKQRSATAAALEKIRAGEGRNVEHVALFDEESLAVIAKNSVVKKRNRKGKQRKT